MDCACVGMLQNTSQGGDRQRLGPGLGLGERHGIQAVHEAHMKVSLLALLQIAKFTVTQLFDDDRNP